MTKDLKAFFSRIIKHSLNIAVLSTLAFSLIAGLAISSANAALAAQGGADQQSGGWWDTVQEGGLDQVGEAYGGGDPVDIRLIVADIIKIVLGFLGVIAVVLVVWAGFKWMTAGGNEENVATAKKILIAGVIGLVIILSAYVITDFVIRQIYGATTGEMPLE